MFVLVKVKPTVLKMLIATDFVGEHENNSMKKGRIIGIKSLVAYHLGVVNLSDACFLTRQCADTAKCVITKAGLLWP